MLRKLLWPIIAFVLFVLGIGAGAGAMMMFTPKPKAVEAVKVVPLNTPPNADLAYDLQPILVALGGNETPGNVLRIELTLQCEAHDAMDRIQAYLPRILDTLQTHLRQASPSSFKGRAGIDQMRAALKPWIDGAIAPAHIQAVVIRQLTVE